MLPMSSKSGSGRFFAAMLLAWCLLFCACSKTTGGVRRQQGGTPMNTLIRKMTRPRSLARGAVIAALYAALTLILAPISYGALQVRVSEALTLLPLLMPEAIPGVTIGCLLANILGGSALPDILFGTLATGCAAIATYSFRRNFWLAASMPVLANGIVVGAVVHFCYTPEINLFLCMLSVAVGEAIACYLLGWLLVRALRRLPTSVLDD